MERLAQVGLFLMHSSPVQLKEGHVQIPVLSVGPLAHERNMKLLAGDQALIPTSSSSLNSIQLLRSNDLGRLLQPRSVIDASCTSVSDTSCKITLRKL